MLRCSEWASMSSVVSTTIPQRCLQSTRTPSSSPRKFPHTLHVYTAQFFVYCCERREWCHTQHLRHAQQPHRLLETINCCAFPVSKCVRVFFGHILKTFEVVRPGAGSRVLVQNWKQETDGIRRQQILFYWFVLSGRTDSYQRIPR